MDCTVNHVCCLVCAGCLLGTCAMLFWRGRSRGPVQPNVMCWKCCVSVDVIEEPGTGKHVAVCPACKKSWPLAE